MDSGKTKESFIHELGRRRIVQVALLYFAIAWTATEVLSFLFEAIPVFPAWSKTLVALLFVLGFPVAMLLGFVVIFLNMENLTENVSQSLDDALTLLPDLLRN